MSLAIVEAFAHLPDPRRELVKQLACGGVVFAFDVINTRKKLSANC